MLQWTAASPHRTLELVVHHTDGDSEYAYDRDPILGSGTGQILAAAAEHTWTVIDMAADWAVRQEHLPARLPLESPSLNRISFTLGGEPAGPARLASNGA